MGLGLGWSAKLPGEAGTSPSQHIHVHQPGSSADLQHAEFLWAFLYTGMTDRVIDHMIELNP